MFPAQDNDQWYTAQCDLQYVEHIIELQTQSVSNVQSSDQRVIDELKCKIFLKISKSLIKLWK